MSKELAYTKGEWQINWVNKPEFGCKVPRHIGIITTSAIGKFWTFVCEIIFPDREDGYERYRNEIEANAKLISQAPAMYELLKGINNYVQHNEDYPEGFFTKVEELIKKIEQ